MAESFSSLLYRTITERLNDYCSDLEFEAEDEKDDGRIEYGGGFLALPTSTNPHFTALKKKLTEINEKSESFDYLVDSDGKCEKKVRFSSKVETFLYDPEQSDDLTDVDEVSSDDDTEFIQFHLWKGINEDDDEEIPELEEIFNESKPYLREPNEYLESSIKTNTGTTLQN